MWIIMVGMMAGRGLDHCQGDSGDNSSVGNGGDRSGDVKGTEGGGRD